MGVKLRDIIEVEKINFKDLNSRTVAIDAYNTIYQFLSSIRQRDGTPLIDSEGNTTSHLSGILYRNSAIIDKGIKPIYVFDGKPSLYKEETVAQRRKVRDSSEKKWKAALKEGDEITARKFAIRSSKMSEYIIDSSKKLLTLMGIPYVDAFGEGEAQAAYMVKNGDAWAVASQDYDCLLFGSERIVRNLTMSNNVSNLEYLELKKVLKKLEITREELVDLSLLVGTDFNHGVKGIGPKTALKIIRKNELKNAMKKIDEDVREIRNLFLKPKINTDYKIKWNKPDKEGMIEFLCEKHEFSKDRVTNVSEKLKKLNNTQKTLEDWF